MQLAVYMCAYVCVQSPSACLSCATNCNKAKCKCTRSSSSACRRNCITCWRKCKHKLNAFLNWSFTKGSRLLNVLMFPGLFKKHKDRYVNQSGRWATREFIVFLDRKVEDNKEILLTFYFLALATFSSALLVFFRYIPVAISSECVETDDQDRVLYCYTIQSESNWPVDCATYNSTELEETQFLCYTIPIPSIGIATAAAVALAKLATVSITIYIRVSAAIYKWSFGNTGPCGTWVYIIYHVAVLGALIVISFGSSSAVALIIQSRWQMDEGHISKRVYLAYAVLPILLIWSLIVIIIALGKHCEQEEYISYSEEQSPKCKEHCDVHDPAKCLQRHEGYDNLEDEQSHVIEDFDVTGKCQGPDATEKDSLFGIERKDKVA